MRTQGLCTLLLLSVLALIHLPAQAQYLPPTPYLSFADSPFATLDFSYLYLEDFEDGALNSPGVALDDGDVVGPGIYRDSVDGDDGVIDGFGTRGHSLYSKGVLTSFTFTFNAAILGALPTHAGIVWTDVGITWGNLGTGFAYVSVEAFDSDGVSLGTVSPYLLGDGAFDGATAEDRFFGVVHDGGISKITISIADSTDWEVDHLQYGRIRPSEYMVPEPGALALLAGMGIGSLLCLRRRRRA